MEDDSLPDDSKKYLTVTERYFTPKYYINPNKKGEDVCLLAHSNKIFVVCLAENHPVLREKKKVSSVDYQFDNVNRLCNRVTGKGKKGGQFLNPDSLLCRICCEDGSKYYVPCGIKCQLLETNDSLKNNPAVLVEKPLSDGYIAIVLPKLKEYANEVGKLLSQTDYNAKKSEVF